MFSKMWKADIQFHSNTKLPLKINPKHKNPSEKRHFFSVMYMYRISFSMCCCSLVRRPCSFLWVLTVCSEFTSLLFWAAAACCFSLRLLLWTPMPFSLWYSSARLSCRRFWWRSSTSVWYRWAWKRGMWEGQSIDGQESSRETKATKLQSSWCKTMHDTTPVSTDTSVI